MTSQICGFNMELVKMNLIILAANRIQKFKERGSSMRKIDAIKNKIY